MHPLQSAYAKLNVKKASEQAKYKKYYDVAEKYRFRGWSTSNVVRTGDKERIHQ